MHGHHHGLIDRRAAIQLALASGLVTSLGGANVLFAADALLHRRIPSSGE